MQVRNEQIELTQIAYAGESFEYPIAPDKYPEQAAADESPKFFNMIVQMASNLAEDLDVEKQDTPWPPSLPQTLTFSTPLLEDYLAEAAFRSITVRSDGADSVLSLNRNVEDWLEEKATWPGVDWKSQAMCAVVGLVDDPHLALQLPLGVNLRRGHAVIFGVPSSGKSTFLRSLVVTLAATHSPGEFHAHLLDLGR